MKIVTFYNPFFLCFYSMVTVSFLWNVLHILNLRHNIHHTIHKDQMCIRDRAYSLVLEMDTSSRRIPFSSAVFLALPYRFT